MEPRRSRRQAKAGPSRAPLLAGAAIGIVALGVAAIGYWPESATIDPSGRKGLAARQPVPVTAGDAAEGTAKAKGDRGPVDEEPRPLTPAQATRLVAPAVVVLDLRGEEDHPLREVRGIVIDPSGVVLCRLRSLFGAHSGVCRLSAQGGTKVEVLGASAYNTALNLVLLRLPGDRTYDAVPVLEGEPARVLEASESAFAFVTQRVEPAVIEKSYLLGADRVARVLLDAQPAIAPESLCLIDVYGNLVGLVRIEVDGEEVPDDRPPPSIDYAALVDPVNVLAPDVNRSVILTLRELTSRFYDGTFDDLLLRATSAFRQKRWREAMDLLEQALDRAAQDHPDEDKVTRASEDLRESYLEEGRRLVGATGRLEEAAGVFGRGVTRFAADPIFPLAVGETRMAQGEWAAGIESLLQSRALEANNKVDELLEKAYLELASASARSGDSRSQELTLLQGIQQLPQSGLLHLELAKLYMQYELYSDAIRTLTQAREIDATLQPTTDVLLAKIDDIIKRREAVIISIPPGAKSPQTQAVIDGHATYNFIVDTGASYTSIPESLAQQLGYDVSSPRVERKVVAGVGGRLSVPIIRVQALNVGGYAVSNLEVIVLPDSSTPDFGLLGMNFLKNFKYTVDSARNELRLERQ